MRWLDVYRGVLWFYLSFVYLWYLVDYLGGSLGLAAALAVGPALVAVRVLRALEK